MGKIRKLRWCTCSAVDWLSATGGLRGAHGGFMPVWCAAWLVWFKDFGPKAYIPGPDECPWIYGRCWALFSMESWLLVWNMAFMTFHILWIIIPTDELIFFRGVESTNQFSMEYLSRFWIYSCFSQFLPKVTSQKGRLDSWSISMLAWRYTSHLLAGYSVTVFFWQNQGEKKFSKQVADKMFGTWHHFWLVVWNLFFIFSIYWEQLSHLTFIFFRGVGQPPSRLVLPRMNAQRLPPNASSDWGDLWPGTAKNIFWVTLSCYTCLFFNTNLARKRLWGEIYQPICCVLDAKTGALLAIFLPTTSQRKLYLRNPLVLVASRRSYMMNHRSATVLHDFPSHSCFQGNFLLSKVWTTKIKVTQ